MKKIHLIAMAMVAAAIVLFVMASGDMATYATFADAARTDSAVKVTGSLAKDKEIHYDPLVDPNYLSFYVRDKDDVERKVVLTAAKPQDFERSESIVLTGKMRGDEFHASDMLMKCPSKYKDEEIYVKSIAGNVE